MPKLDLIKTFQFEAAHRTAHDGDPARLHGHSYKVDLLVEGELDPALGWVMDYAEISEAFAPIYNQLDHQSLNELEGAGDTKLPKLRDWIYEHAKPLIPLLREIQLTILGECAFDPLAFASSDASDLPDRVRFGFEAAHALPNLPTDHKCHAMHGHSFIVEVAADDTTTLTSNLQSLYDILDHQCLNNIEGLQNPTSEKLSIWIWNHLAESRDDVTAVLVAETCTARCIYRGQ